MITTILVLLMIAAILLIIVILVQNPKGGGLSSEFGGGSTSQMFGVQKTGDILEKLTWGFFAFILIGAIATGILSKLENNSSLDNSIYDVEKAQTLPSAPAPLSTPTTEGTSPLSTPDDVPAAEPAE